MLNDAWNLLQVGDEVSVNNLVTFVIALENIFVPQMTAIAPVQTERRLFGYLVGDSFYLDDESEVHRLNRHFSCLVAQKKLSARSSCTKNLAQ